MVKRADHSAVIFGTHFPNRLFVGCLPPKASAKDLAEFFKVYGAINQAKVVLDDAGNSKRFGFVSFEDPESVQKVLSQGSIFFQDKKVNIGPAVKKQVKDDVVGTPAVIAYDKNSLTSSRVKFQEIQPPLSSHSSSTASHLHVSQKPVEAPNFFQIQSQPPCLSHHQSTQQQLYPCEYITYVPSTSFDPCCHIPAPELHTRAMHMQQPPPSTWIIPPQNYCYLPAPVQQTSVQSYSVPTPTVQNAIPSLTYLQQKIEGLSPVFCDPKPHHQAFQGKSMTQYGPEFISINACPQQNSHHNYLSHTKQIVYRSS